jgi:diacylglycerol kinase (ATP)
VQDLPLPAGAVLIGVDGRQTRQRAAVTIANGERYGGGLRIAPGRTPDDGLLDIAVVGDPGRLRRCALSTVYFSRRQPRIPSSRAARSLDTVDPGQSLPLHVDGTPFGGTPARFSVEPLSLIVLSLR